MQVKTAELKNNLSKYLRRVRELGETIIVCDRTLNYSWDWMRVEAETAMRRRNAPQPAFKSLQVLLQSFHWLSVTPADYEAVCSLNSRHRLRAADAGHLFCLHRAAKVFPEIQLVGFDHDLAAAARMENLNVWSPA